MAAFSAEGSSAFTALYLLDYVHAPVVALFFTGALVYGACALQTGKPVPRSSKKLQLALVLIFLQVLSYVASAVFYLRLALFDERSAPQHNIIHVLGSLLVWGCIGLALFTTNAPLWNAYFGSFALDFVFEVSICASSGISGSEHNVHFVVYPVRAIISLGLLVDGYLMMVKNWNEQGKDEESQTLLGSGTNGSTDVTGKVSTYGAISTDPENSDGDEEEEEEDDDKEVKEQQRKRLEEQGGWLNYLKGFSLFLPYLWPKDNKKVQLCLLVLAMDVVVDRFLHILIPRQIGIITNKLTMGTGVMPWKDIALWTFYSWVGSYGGFGMIVHVASTVAENYTYQRISNLSFRHVMDLSMDFHSNKDSGEVIKSVDQAESLTDILQLLMFDVLPIFFDLMVAIWYVPYLFGPYMGFILLVLGISYVWSGVTLTAWAQPKRRKYMEKSRMENSTYSRTLV
jgi:hypothetical protein